MEINKLNQNSFGKNIVKLAEIPGLRCALCNSPLLRASEVDAFIRKVCGEKSSMPSGQSIARYMDTMCYQKAAKMELLSKMEHYAKLYPDKSFGEIFAMPDVMEHHLQASNAYFAANYEKSSPLFKSMEKNLNLSPEQKEKLTELHRNAVKIAIGNMPDGVKRYLIMQNYGAFQSEIGGIRVAKMQEYASRIPLLPGCPDSMLYHMRGKTDASIMQSFLSSVTPRKKRIELKDGNGFVICQPCSSVVDLIPFKSLFYVFPDMFKNLQNQLNTIITALAKGDLRGHGDYPKVLQRLVAQATEGERILDLGKYTRNRKQIVQRSSQPLCKAEIEQIKQDNLKRYENILLRESPDKLKELLISAEKTKREMIARGAQPAEIKSEEKRINLLRKVYIALLRRDKLI